MINKQEQKPPSEELARFVRSVAQSAGFYFKADEGSPLILLNSSDHYYWTINGKLPLIYNGKKAELKFETRDVHYVNALGRATDGVALFRYSDIDGERRFNDIEETLVLCGLQVGGKREYSYYNSFWRKKIGKQREDFECRFEKSQEAENIRLMLEEAGKIVGERFPNFVGILDSPHYWARENYGQSIDDVLNAEFSLLKTERSLPKTVVGSLMRRLFG